MNLSDNKIRHSTLPLRPTFTAFAPQGPSGAAYRFRHWTPGGDRWGALCMSQPAHSPSLPCFSPTSKEKE